MSTAEDRNRPTLRAVESDESLPSVREADPHLAWRAGRPVEDPDKTKRWGLVTAQPSEYLIHMRRGKIRRRSTGQGASCFKLPWDSVAVIPTTINRLQFTADQVTLEKVGMRVTGLAVYRIVAPEITFRMLNFSYTERASQKLAEILQEMFVGATRRHVANLSVEDVMTRRKDAIGAELMTELAPVLDGSGRVDDQTSMGWGVVLDTVEIQDVRVLSEEVFANMQAAFRSELALRARTAELSREAEITARETAHEREITKARVEAESDARRVRAAAESRSTEIELAEETARAELRAKAREAEVAREQAVKVAALAAAERVAAAQAEQQERSALAELERKQRLLVAARELAEREHTAQLRDQAQVSERELTAQAADAELAQAKIDAESRVAQRRIEIERAAQELALSTARARKDIEDTISDARIQLELVSSALPAIAEAFGQQIGELRLTQIGTGDDPSQMLANGISKVLEIAKSLGLGGPGARGQSPKTSATS